MYNRSKNLNAKPRSKRVACTCPNCKDADKNSGRKMPHNCHIAGCNKSYGQTSHLRAHLRWHIGEQPYLCSWKSCKKRFTRSDQLRRHLRTHSGEKQYQCCECQKTFNRSDHLNKHIKTHIRTTLADADVSNDVDSNVPIKEEKDTEEHVDELSHLVDDDMSNDENDIESHLEDLNHLPDSNAFIKKEKDIEERDYAQSHLVVPKVYIKKENAFQDHVELSHFTEDNMNFKKEEDIESDVEELQHDDMFTKEENDLESYIEQPSHFPDAIIPIKVEKAYIDQVDEENHEDFEDHVKLCHYGDDTMYIKKEKDIENHVDELGHIADMFTKEENDLEEYIEEPSNLSDACIPIKEEKDYNGHQVDEVRQLQLPSIAGSTSCMDEANTQYLEPASDFCYKTKKH